MTTMEEFQQLKKREDKAHDDWVRCWDIIQRKLDLLVRAGVVAVEEKDAKRTGDHQEV